LTVAIKRIKFHGVATKQLTKVPQHNETIRIEMMTLIDRFKLIRFATGGYQNKCDCCGDAFHGDKLARTCFRCACEDIDKTDQWRDISTYNYDDCPHVLLHPSPYLNGDPLSGSYASAHKKWFADGGVGAEILYPTKWTPLPKPPIEDV
jgi:hypothetical protein